MRNGREKKRGRGRRERCWEERERREGNEGAGKENKKRKEENKRIIKEKKKRNKLERLRENEREIEIGRLRKERNRGI